MVWSIDLSTHFSYTWAAGGAAAASLTLCVCVCACVCVMPNGHTAVVDVLFVWCVEGLRLMLLVVLMP